MSRRRIYIGKISYDSRSRDVEDEFSRYGRIRDFHMRDGYAFVTYDSGRDAEDAIHDMDGRRFDGSRLIVEFAKERGERDERRTAVRPSGEYRVMVEGLPDRTSWQDLKDHMKSVGEVGFCDVTDGGVKGWAEYRNDDDMQRAISTLNGSSYQGGIITVFREGVAAPPAAAAAAASERSRSRSRSPSPERKRSRSRSASRSPSPSKKAREESPQE